MIKNSTLFLSQEQTNNNFSPKQKVVYSPSKKSIREILSFAAAYEPIELKICKEKDIILN